MAEPSTKPKRERRLLRFSLQSLFLVVSVVAAFLGGRAANQEEVDRLQEEIVVMRWELQIQSIIENLESDLPIASRFAVGQCEKLGPKARAALPALKSLRDRKPVSPEFRARIDATITAVEGRASTVATP